MKNCERVISLDRNCNIIILDDFDENYVNIYVILHISSNGESTNVVLLKEKESDEIICNFKMDGNYSICRIDVPLYVNPPLVNSPYYYKDGKFYKNVEEVELKEIISINPNSLVYFDKSAPKINFNYDHYFNTCNLKKCYIKICLEIFDKKVSLKCDTSNVDSLLTYKRDLLNSVLNVINYMVQFKQYAEAQRLLERISGCNGLCNEISNSSSCGCMQV